MATGAGRQTARAALALGGLFVVLLVLPAFANPYVLSAAILVLYFAYVGQAWNLMMGFAGQLSLGHSLYVGLGAYASAALFVHYGISPWIGLVAAVAVSLAAGAVIGFLAFRFGIGGVYFALLTIAFAEFTRIGFDHFDWVGGSGGFFLPVKEHGVTDLANLRGPPVMFYYIALAMAAGAFLAAWRLRASRIGYYWLAIRENEDAAQALGINTFRYKMLAILFSSAMTALAGVFFAFYYNNLFPEQIFSMARSIEIILGPIIGGLGTLFGPVLGAFVLTFLGDGLTEVTDAFGIQIPGLKQVFYGVALLVVVVFVPNGIWPALARRLGFGPAKKGE
ncbi:MAG: branched-chain amino acid ABC transporter permease [Burkholderiales bacterium]|nr:branched-chain amino acid ABC transporter permease [Burkholderiales bacterium]